MRIQQCLCKLQLKRLGIFFEMVIHFERELSHQLIVILTALLHCRVIYLLNFIYYIHFIAG